jgi:Flp pilus assembly protein TadG
VTHMSFSNICSRSFSASRYLSEGARCCLNRSGLIRRFSRDQSGSYVILSALLMPVLVGTAGLGTEVGWWYYKHKNMQSAADSGAVSAATAVTAGTDLLSEANAVTVNRPGFAGGSNS